VKSVEKCPLCGGIIEHRLIKCTHEFDGQIIIIENVPARVCNKCGEKLLSPETTKKIHNIFCYQKAPRKQIEVFIFDLASL